MKILYKKDDWLLLFYDNHPDKFSFFFIVNSHRFTMKHCDKIIDRLGQCTKCFEHYPLDLYNKMLFFSKLLKY